MKLGKPLIRKTQLGGFLVVPCMSLTYSFLNTWRIGALAAAADGSYCVWPRHAMPPECSLPSWPMYLLFVFTALAVADSAKDAWAFRKGNPVPGVPGATF